MAHQTREILQGFWSSEDRRLQWRLAKAWSSWREIVGPDIADMAKPLGRNKSTLLLGVEDPMVMQELHFHAPAILVAVNSALGEKLFDKVRLDLLGGRSSLAAIAEEINAELAKGRKKFARSSPESYPGLASNGSGHSENRFAGVPALARCYRAYVRTLARMKTQRDQDG